MVDMLGFISDQLDQLGVPYEFGEWTGEISYPYFVGSFNETEHRLEDGYTGGVFTLDGWSRGSKLPLAEINDKLKKAFEDLRAVQEGTAFFITYWNGLMIPTGEEDLFRITITLNTKKLRKIYKLPYFPDRICQWAILQVIEPCIINNLTADTYSAIPNRGIHKGLTKLQSAMWNDPEECRYCLKLDARHYYQSINHDLLKEKYSRMFNDNELLWLLNEIIDSIETAEIEDLTAIYLLEEDIDSETGIPIGNYLSQYSGNYYFSSFDHWIKEQKHVKYYFRYMDDMVIFGKTKEELFALKKEIDIYFRNELKLNIKENWQVSPSYVRGVDFLGYRTFYKYTLLRKSTCLEMEKKMTAIRNKVEAGNMMNYSEWCSINSYKGWLKYADTFRLYQKYVVPLLPYADDYYIRNIKPSTKKGLKVS